MSKPPPELDVIAWMAQEMREDVIPPGWATAQQIAKATGAGLDTVRMRLDRAAKAGKIDSKKIRLADANGGPRKTLIYSMKGAANGKARANAGTDGQERPVNHRRTRKP